MRVTLRNPYLSIKQMDEFDLPHFAVLIGRNGVGKTQLLTAIAQGHIAVSGLSRPEIELYDFGTFRSSDSEQSTWGASEVPRATVQQYFTPPLGDPLVRVAETIFHDTLKTFDLVNDSDRRIQFEEQIRDAVRNIPDFSILEPDVGGNANVSYLSAIRHQVIDNLSRGKQRKNVPPTTVGDDQAKLVSLAMKLNGKLPHELTRNDIYSACDYEGGTFENRLSQIFARYKVDQYWWAHTEGEKSDKSVRTLMRQYRESNSPPWDTLRLTLARMRDASYEPELFNFDFSDPEEDTLSYADHRQYSFGANFVNKSTGESYSLNSLSSGEKDYFVHMFRRVQQDHWATATWTYSPRRAGCCTASFYDFCVAHWPQRVVRYRQHGCHHGHPFRDHRFVLR